MWRRQVTWTARSIRSSAGRWWRWSTMPEAKHYSKRTIDKALATFDGLEEIIRVDRLVHLEYVTGVDAPERAGQVCQGRRACLLGATWLAHGAAVRKENGTLFAEGVYEADRAEYLARRPALR